MKLNSPLPQSLPKECEKAAKIFRSFVDSGNNGLDGIIPRSVLEQAKGFAIFTIFKAGFLVSARAGSGVVIARLADGTWSAPSAIGTAGLGVGSQLGAEMTDFLVVLNSRSAIQSFMSAGSLTLGGNLSVAIGPLGRNGEAVGSVNTSGKLAAMYSYSKTRGLFGGLSIEGSVIMERQDANTTAYRSPVTARMLLGGVIDPPPWAAPLIDTLDMCTGMPGGRKWVNDGVADGHYAFGGVSNPKSEPRGLLSKKKKDNKPSFPPTSWGEARDTGSYFTSRDEEFDQIGTSKPKSRRDSWDQGNNTVPFESQYEVDPDPRPSRHSRSTRSLSYSTNEDLDTTRSSIESPLSSKQRFHTKSQSLTSPVIPSLNPFESSSTSRRGSNVLDNSEYGHRVDDSAQRSRDDRAPVYFKPKPELIKPLDPHEGVARAIALYTFQAVESGDLSFSKGDIIVVVKKSDSSDDWWTGKIGDREGIFPANFVEVV